jgi:hypothetical protein
MQPPQVAAQQHPLQGRFPVYVPYSSNSVTFAAVPLVLQAAPMPPSKRPADSEDAEGQPSKTKKARGKGKASESNGSGQPVFISTVRQGTHVYQAQGEAVPPRSAVTRDSQVQTARISPNSVHLKLTLPCR